MLWLLTKVMQKTAGKLKAPAKSIWVNNCSGVMARTRSMAQNDRILRREGIVSFCAAFRATPALCYIDPIHSAQ
jgi:hypothetical protein